jgi:hypothetical protein
MSLVIISRALEKKLALLTPALATAYENKDFTPVNGTAYQKANLLPATPDNQTIGSGYYKERGVFQVTLCYPQNANALDARTRAELLKAHFERGTTMVESGLTVIVTLTPSIAPAFIADARYCMPVSIFYECDINT